MVERDVQEQEAEEVEVVPAEEVAGDPETPTEGEYYPDPKGEASVTPAEEPDEKAEEPTP